MPDYIDKLLKRIQDPTPKKPQHAPHKCVANYLPAQQQTPIAEPDGETLPPEHIKRVQQILGSLLYYARAVDPTLLVTLSSLEQYQATPNNQTQGAINQVLDYCATHPQAILQYRQSDMILKIHTDSSYLSEPKARSRVGGIPPSEVQRIKSTTPMVPFSMWHPSSK